MLRKIKLFAADGLWLNAYAMVFPPARIACVDMLCACLLAPVEAASLNTAQNLAVSVFPDATGWKSYRLADEVQLLRCQMAEKKTHMYIAVRKAKGAFRLVMTHGVHVEDDQYVRFALKDGAVLAYHCSGVLLARMPMWETPPALYAPASELVRLRLAGTGDDLILCDAENLTDSPVLLRSGKVFIISTDDEVKLSSLSARLGQETLLPPRASCQLRLDIISKRRTNPTGLSGHERVDLVYRADDVKPGGPSGAVAPAYILQAGMPELGAPGYHFPIRLRDDLVVCCRHGIGGRIDVMQLDFYRLSGSLWQHVSSTGLHSNYPPFGYKCDGNRVQVYAFGGRRLADIQLP